MIFNGLNFDEFATIEYIRRNLLPPRNILTKNAGQMHSYFSKVEYGIDKIEVDVRIIAENRNKVLDIYKRMATALNTDKPMTLWLRDEPDKFNVAILSGDTVLHNFLDTGFVTLIFECPDPYLYGQDIQELRNVNGKTCYNGGGADTIGEIIVHVDRTINDIYIKLNGQDKLRILNSFVNGDTIEIDLYSEQIWKNTSIFTPATLDSDFFELPLGEFTITTNAGELDVRFRERW